MITDIRQALKQDCTQRTELNSWNDIDLADSEDPYRHRVGLLSNGERRPAVTTDSGSVQSNSVREIACHLRVREELVTVLGSR